MIGGNMAQVELMSGHKTLVILDTDKKVVIFRDQMTDSQVHEMTILANDVLRIAGNMIRLAEFKVDAPEGY
jgi:hypothetical protein